MTPISLYIAIMGLLAFRFGLLTSVGDDGSVQVISPGLAGSGMATFLGVLAAQVLS